MKGEQRIKTCLGIKFSSAATAFLTFLALGTFTLHPMALVAEEGGEHSVDSEWSTSETQLPDTIKELRAGVLRDTLVPFEDYTSDQKRGLGGDLLEIMARDLGVEITTTVFDSRELLYRALDKGDIHLVLARPHSDLSTKPPSLTTAYLALRPLLIFGKDVVWEGEVSKLKIALPRHSIRLDYLERYYSGTEVVLTDSNEAALEKVAQGEADAYISSDITVAGDIVSSTQPELLRIGPRLPTPPISVHYQVSPRFPYLVSIINNAYARIDEKERYQVFGDWVGTISPQEGNLIALSGAEREIVSDYSQVRLAMEGDAYPLSHEEEGGDVIGFSPDVSAMLFSALNLPVKQQVVNALDKGLELLKKGQTDLLLMSVTKGDYPPGVVVSQPLASFPIMAVMRQASPTLSDLSQLEGMRVAANTNKAWFSRVLQKTPGLLSHHEANLDEALAGLYEHKVDVVLAGQAALDTYLRGNYLGQLKVAAATGEYEDLVFLARDEDEALINLLDRAMAVLVQHDFQRLKNNWMGGTYIDASGLQWRELFSVLVFPGIIVLSVIAGLLISRQKLRKEVARREITEQRLADVTRNLPAVIYKIRMDREENLSVPLMIGDTLKILGVEKEELERDPFFLFSEPGVPGETTVKQCLKSSVDKLDPIWHEKNITGNEGESRWIATYLVPRQVAKGDIHWNGYWVDVTKQHQQADSLAEAKERAELATRSTRSFLAAISHEVRTPMSGIIGTLELINQSELSASQQRMISLVADASESLLQILDDVLDFFKLDANKLVIHPEATDLRHLADFTLNVLSSRVYEKGLHLRLYLDSRLAAFHEVDGLRLRQILFNLVSNATKFTEDGCIDVRIEVVDEVDDWQTVRLQVSDTGIGIDKDKQSELFVPFAQVDDVRTRYLGGTGLGLPICRQLVDLMGGSVELESEIDAGTRVTAEFPLRVTKALPDRQPLSELKIDISLSDADLADGLEEILRYYGAEIVEDAESADVKVRDEGSGDREQTDTVHVTSRPLGMGADQDIICSNPFRLADVLEVIRRHAGYADDQLPDVIKPPIALPEMPGDTRLLVVEDNALIQSVLSEQLTRLGVGFDMAENGQIALERVKQNRYTLILTDCHMPELDGFELTRQLRAIEQKNGWARIPVIGMTANLMDGQRDSCFNVGMDDVLGKPVRMLSLSSMLRQWLQSGYRQETPMATAVPPGFEEFLGIFGDPDKARAMLEKLVVECRKDLGELRLAKKNKDKERLGQIVHRSLSGVRMLNESSTLEMALALDAQYQQGHELTLSQVDTYVSELCESLDVIEAWLSSQRVIDSP